MNIPDSLSHVMIPLPKEYWQSIPEEEPLMVRNKEYLTAPEKIASTPLFQLTGVFLLPSIKSLSEIEKIINQFQTETREESDETLEGEMVNGDNVKIYLQYQLDKFSVLSEHRISRRQWQDQLSENSLWQRLVDEENTKFRQSRLKLIPKFHYLDEGRQPLWGGLIKSIIRSKPVIIGNKINVNYHLTSLKDNNRFMIIQLDLQGGMMIRNTLYLLQTPLQSYRLDLGVVIQGEQVEELPEQLLIGERYTSFNYAKVIELSKKLSIHSNEKDE